MDSKTNVIDVTKASELKLAKSVCVYIKPYATTKEVFDKSQMSAELEDMVKYNVVMIVYIENDKFRIRNLLARQVVVNLNVKKEEINASSKSSKVRTSKNSETSEALKQE